ncbi:DUF1203 domain-containing protein [Thalassovita aquimarina]|uniref:DUF1203 domain-containing protein n=1 Tax=Thalassovita aquimarina TaxID=2785917 RepID=A0ABS5HL46_9RHOB|nr:DUF1203 domain-containing protein [Thalassovita aquimarina]MBR9649697.1 DUF1203 domain-containing protein [Thalassovita aquimarina]
MIFQGLNNDVARGLRAGGPDANGMAPERGQGYGTGSPCRHCLDHVGEGAGMLICAHRPFSVLQPYAELGPIFLCAEDCAPYRGCDLPPVLTTSHDYLVKGYSADERIVYGTGQVTPRAELEAYVAQLLARADIAFVDIRSARNNCWIVRATRD